MPEEASKELHPLTKTEEKEGYSIEEAGKPALFSVSGLV